MTKHLLLDSRIIDHTENVSLTLGAVEKDARNPLFVEDKPWEPRFDNLYANVTFDEGEGLYKCWYSPFIVDERSHHVPHERRTVERYMELKKTPREMGVCYATSRDGIEWEKPELGLVEFEGSTANNLLVRGPHGAGIFRDHRDPDPARRYKMFVRHEHMGYAFSSDGIHWPEPTPCEVIAARGDTHNNAFWAPELGKHVGITRLWDPDTRERIVGRTESDDFVRWTQAVEVLRSLPQEGPSRQAYAMPVFRCAGVYLGLLMLLDTDTDMVDCELAWSADTVHWERVCPGRPLIPRGPEGSIDCGCIYAAAYPVFLDNEIRLYYGGNNGPHTNWRDGFFCLARLRPDGFAGMEPSSPDARGTIITKPIPCPGGRLTVTADVAAGGSLRAEVVGTDGLSIAESEPITSDVTDAPVRWQRGSDLSALGGKEIALRFELARAKLYALSLVGCP